MKRIFKYILVISLFFAISVKADYSAPGIVPNYTTVYQGDTITFDLGNDDIWDESIVVSTINDDTHDYDFIKSAEDNYLVEPIYLIVDSDTFELDISENKVLDDNILFTDYKKELYGDKTVYEFDFELKSLKDSEDGDLYDGIIDNILVTNLKLKVKEKAPLGVHYVQTHRTTDFDEEYYSDSFDPEFIPITIISNESKDNSLGYYFLESKSEGLAAKSDFNFKTDKNEYELLYFGDINYTNLNCNSRCKVTGIGSDVYYEDEAENLEYSIKYEDNKEEKFVVKNELKKASIKKEWVDNFSKSIIVVGNSSLENPDGIINNVAESISYYKDGFQGHFYDYDKLNDTDKKILEHLNESFDDLSSPYIFAINDGKIVYKYHGIPSNEELNTIQNKVDKTISDNSSNPSNRIGICEGENCTRDDGEESFGLQNYYMYILIGLSIIVILLILIITILKSKSKRTSDF